MTSSGPGSERAMLSVLLLLTALGCAVIAAGTESPVRKKEQRRAQGKGLADRVLPLITSDASQQSRDIYDG